MADGCAAEPEHPETRGTQAKPRFQKLITLGSSVITQPLSKSAFKDRRRTLLYSSDGHMSLRVAAKPSIFYVFFVEHTLDQFINIPAPVQRPYHAHPINDSDSRGTKLSRLVLRAR